ncbi:hypothetical protein GCM10010502_25620 [Kitasatospora aureofaciens]|uniref:Uncharacterized protein n=1 Tax=Kitasatospora aureofaciens TaxID=1894 RepID=A0A8H9HLU6_KITAU|nr:hypothetical protein GCM10010502_25620 [Kitasatospora aureofaciens]
MREIRSDLGGGGELHERLPRGQLEGQLRTTLVLGVTHVDDTGGFGDLDALGALIGALTALEPCQLRHGGRAE